MWVTGIIVEQVLHMIFSFKTGRKYQFDNWRVLDFIMFGVMITLMLELHERYLGEDNLVEWIEP